MNVLVLHGPTLQFLGHREGDPPGLTLAEVDRRLAEKARALGHVLRTVQSNHEGALVDALWEQRSWAEGVVLNPGPLAPGSHVLTVDRPAGMPENLTRIVVQGSTSTPHEWLRLHVDRKSEGVFSCEIVPFGGAAHSCPAPLDG